MNRPTKIPSLICTAAALCTASLVHAGVTKSAPDWPPFLGLSVRF